jgi:membrane protease YdiL (CAAX protease family)
MRTSVSGVSESMNIFGFIKRHPVLTYYVLTFAISWGAIVAAVGPGGFPAKPAQITKTLPLLIAAMLGGPGIASALLTGIVGGRAGYRDLLTRLFQWRVGIHRYVAAVLIAPLLLMAVPLALSLGNPEFIPRIFTDDNRGPLLQMGFAAGLSVGIFEELGWTGFVIPELRLRFDTITTGAMVGFLWGAWHIPVNVLASGTPSGALSMLNLLGGLVFSFGILPAFRVLMVWVYDHTESLLLAMLMHMSLAASNIIFGLASAKGMSSASFSLAISVALWIVIATSAVASRRPSPVHSLGGQ